MAYVVLDLKSFTVLHEAETKGLCNQWLLENFIEKKYDRNAACSNPFSCPYKVMIVREDKVICKESD